MRIEGQSSNVEDRRGQSFGGRGLIGGGIGTLVLVVVGLFFGIDPRVILGLSETAQQVQQTRAPQGPAKAPTDTEGQFVSGVLLDTEKTWNALFRQLGRDYGEPKVVISSAPRVRRAAQANRRWARFIAARSERLH